MNHCSRGSARRNPLKNRISSFIEAFLSRLPGKGFSALSIIFLGVTAFPSLPEIDTEVLLKKGDTETEAIVAMRRDELCLWQKDFSFFTELVGETGPDQISVPCEDQSLAFTAPQVVEKAVSPAPEPLTDAALLERIVELAEGYPLESMAPAIAEYDREVAALIVGIAKKESNWGKRVPRSSDGADCFNYWGWKGAGSRGVAMGHGCFGSKEEAVTAVGNRITQLVALRKTSEPKNMIVWKCGSSCATHTPESVAKWIADVDLYYKKIVKN
jgi:hypothetical protein